MKITVIIYTNKIQLFVNDVEIQPFQQDIKLPLQNVYRDINYYGKSVCCSNEPYLNGIIEEINIQNYAVKDNYIQCFVNDKCDVEFCQKCIKQNDRCKVCKSNRILGQKNGIQDQCICPVKTFDTQNESCPDCISNCLQCENLNQCIQCENGYFLDNNFKCIQCLLKYETCNDLNTGTKCQGQNRSQDLPACDCLPGYLDIENTNQSDCQSCIDCKTCKNIQTFCLSCNDGYFLFNNKCIKCPNKFQKCTNELNGLECQGNNRSIITPNCFCNIYYYDDLVNADCVKCKSPCLTCDTEIICQSCIKGYYYKDNVCNICLLKYEACDDLNTGTKCQGQNISQDLPACDCLPGYLDIENTNQSDCQPCFYPCKICIKSQSNCLNCINDLYRIQDTQQKCECQSGYYDDLQKCQKCQIQCKECSENSSNCTKCNGQNSRKDIPNCTCQENLNELFQQDCLKCSNKCQKCISDINICTICAKGKGRNNKIDLINPDQSCSCQDGYYNNQKDQDCQECNISCKTCSDNQICDTCFLGSLQNPQDLCNFKVTKNIIVFENQPQQQTEQQCLKRCNMCTNTKDNCNKCSQGINRLQKYPQCSCKQGFHDNRGLDLHCIGQCHQNCLSCQDSFSCDKCKQNWDKYDINDKLCKKCLFSFNGQCLESCPEQTKLNNETNFCEYEQKIYIQQEINNYNYLYFGGILLLVLIIIVFIFKCIIQ